MLPDSGDIHNEPSSGTPIPRCLSGTNPGVVLVMGATPANSAARNPCMSMLWPRKACQFRSSSVSGRRSDGPLARPNFGLIFGWAKAPPTHSTRSVVHEVGRRLARLVHAETDPVGAVPVRE